MSRERYRTVTGRMARDPPSAARRRSRTGRRMPRSPGSSTRRARRSARFTTRSASASDSSGEPARLVAEQPRRRLARAAVARAARRSSPFDVGGEHAQARRARALRARRRARRRPRSAGGRSIRSSRARPSGCRGRRVRPVRIDGVGARGIRGPDDRAGVAGVAHLLEDRDQARRLPANTSLHRGRELPADRDDALRRDRVGHRVEHVLGDELDVDARRRARPRAMSA